MTRIVVIGGGIAGLSAAAALARDAEVLDDTGDSRLVAVGDVCLNFINVFGHF